MMLITQMKRFLKVEEEKEMLTNEMICALEEKGFKRWTKGNLDRMYVNAS